MDNSASNNTYSKVKKLRIKLLIVVSIFILPSLVFSWITTNYQGVDKNPLFITAIFIYILIATATAGLFILLFASCPNCGQGYFSKYGLPKLFYKLKCQNCGFSVFKSYNKRLWRQPKK